MLSVPVDPDAVPDTQAERRGLTDAIRRSFIKGLAILLPLVITLFVISIVFGFISRALDPLLALLTQTPYLGPLDDRLALLLTVVVFGAVVLLIGSVSEYGSDDRRIRDQYDQFMASIPGFGRIYRSFDEMSELILESDTDSFQEVKLVEYPGEDSYVVAFKTADTPEVIAESTSTDDMVTLFMPMAPNPVMGGFVIHVSRDRVVDVDLSVEEGIRSIVTSGVASGQPVDGPPVDDAGTAGPLVMTDDQAAGDGGAEEVGVEERARRPTEEPTAGSDDAASEEPTAGSDDPATGARSGAGGRGPNDGAGTSPERGE